jgi:hypothetical protein
MTACRLAMPLTPQEALAPPRGTPTPPRLARDDPRWMRPPPWVEPIVRTIGPRGFLIAIGLALVNVVVPLGLLRLAARRRPWTLRLLMVLPIAAAVPLWMFQTVGPHLPLQLGSQQVTVRMVFVGGTLLGLPIVVWAWSVVAGLVRFRWRRLALLAGLTIAASAVVAGMWLTIDMRTMPAIEHYDRSGWYLTAVPGVYAVGVLMMIGWALRGGFRWLRRPWQRHPAITAVAGAP